MAAKLPRSFDIDALPEIDLWRVVVDFSPYLRIAHQIDGRVRLKVDATVFDDPKLNGLGPGRLRAALSAVRGVHAVSLNLLARSCVVEYDSAVIPDAAWRDLLAGHQTDAAMTLLDLLAAAAAAHRTTHQKENAP
jgi:hypothetical protein